MESNSSNLLNLPLWSFIVVNLLIVCVCVHACVCIPILGWVEKVFILILHCFNNVFQMK